MILQVFFYSQGIFEEAKVPAEYIPFAIIGTNAVNVLMTLVAVSYLAMRPCTEFITFHDVLCSSNLIAELHQRTGFESHCLPDELLMTS